MEHDKAREVPTIKINNPHRVEKSKKWNISELVSLYYTIGLKRDNAKKK